MAMARLLGHAAGNGGHSQGKPTATMRLLYSERERIDTAFPAEAFKAPCLS